MEVPPFQHNVASPEDHVPRRRFEASADLLCDPLCSPPGLHKEGPPHGFSESVQYVTVVAGVTAEGGALVNHLDQGF